MSEINNIDSSNITNSQEADLYLKKKVKVILEPLVAYLLKDKPDEPVSILQNNIIF